MNPRSASAVALCSLLLADAQAQLAPPPSDPPTLAPVAAESRVFSGDAVALKPLFTTENSLVAFGDATQSLQNMRERLQDPVQRVALRAEQRENLLQSHEGIGRILGIDAATHSALIELLTDLQMEQLDSFHSRMGRMPAAGESVIHLEAARHTRRIEQLRELLGESGLEAYQAFDKSLGERLQIRMFDERLDPAHKLTPEQKERLVPAYRALNERSRSDSRATLFSRQPLLGAFRALPDQQELQRISLLQNIAINEELWRRLPDNHRFLKEGVTPILTQPQLATFVQLQSEQLNQHQQRIEQMRMQAGLNIQIPEVSDTTTNAAPARIPRDGDVKVSLRVSIDRKKPLTFSQVVRNGSSATFDAGDGISVDATPTLYSNGQFYLQIAYYEQHGNERRPIGEMGQGGDISNQGELVDLEHSGGSGSVLVGRKGYAVEMDSRVEAI